MTEPKVAVVTGAGSGLGRVIGTALLGAGYRVALAGRRADALAETAGGHEAALVVPTDVREENSVAALFDAVRQAWGRVDLLVNNAGMFGPGGTVDSMTVADWRNAVDTNLTGSFLCAREAFALMRSHAAAARHRGSRRVLLRQLGHHGLGGDQEAGHGGCALQGRAHHLGRIDDALRHHVDVLARLGVVAVVVLILLQDLADHHRAVLARIEGDLARRPGERLAHDLHAGLLVVVAGADAS